MTVMGMGPGLRPWTPPVTETLDRAVHTGRCGVRRRQRVDDRSQNAEANLEPESEPSLPWDTRRDQPADVWPWVSNPEPLCSLIPTVTATCIFTHFAPAALGWTSPLGSQPASPHPTLLLCCFSWFLFHLCVSTEAVSRALHTVPPLHLTGGSLCFCAWLRRPFLGEQLRSTFQAPGRVNCPVPPLLLKGRKKERKERKPQGIMALQSRIMN